MNSTRTLLCRRRTQRTHRMFHASVWLVLLCAASVPLCVRYTTCSAFAQERRAPDTATVTSAANEIFFEVLSPFCPGRSLHDCPSGAATDLKNEIRASLVRGESKEEIVEGLVKQFGEEIRAVPPTSGFSLLAWVTPLGFLLVGGILIAWWVKRNAAGVTSEETKSAEETPLNPEMERRLAEEMRRGDS